MKIQLLESPDPAVVGWRLEGQGSVFHLWSPDPDESNRWIVWGNWPGAEFDGSAFALTDALAMLPDDVGRVFLVAVMDWVMS